ncbi:MAG TPA: hypothetical protein VGL26_06030 [Jatrophihabitans sp.]|jgi:MinD-like ATPase involved in chromosome partitioning or flagellar assembly
MQPVIGVVGGHGGVGASSLAAVLASVAGASLVDVDPSGGGIDVLLGIEDVAGARWSALRLGGGSLDAVALTAALPRWGEVAVLAADAEPHHVDEVVQALGSVAPVILDLPRCSGEPLEAAAALCSLVVVLVAAEVRPLVAARTLIAGLPQVPTGVVARPGAVPAAQLAHYLAAPLLGALPGRCLVRPGRPLPRAAVRLAQSLLQGSS